MAQFVTVQTTERTLPTKKFCIDSFVGALKKKD